MNRLLMVVISSMLLIPTIVYGQAETTGRISGRVVDEAGNPVVGARVTLISSAMQGERKTETGANGGFLAALLPVGPYAVSVAAPGKETVQVSLRLGVGQTAPLDITMKEGEKIVERVTVHAAATPLETTIVGENFNYETTVEELPMASRNLLDVARYSPNVVDGPWAPDVLVGTTTGIVVSGALAYDTTVQLDGADISDPIVGQGLLLYLEDAIEEVQVQTSGISARYGRFQGGVINTITKAGGNQFNGTVRAEFYNESWNSTTPFGEEQSDKVNQIYQATLGGFVIRDKLWFFAGARLVPTETLTTTTIVTGESYEGQTDDRRWQLKLRGAPRANHVIEASYLERDFETTSGGRGPGDLLAASAYYNLEPMSLFTLAYQGILSTRSFLDIRVSGKRHGTTCCSTGEARSTFWDFGLGTHLNNGDHDPDTGWSRDGESVSVAYTNVFGGASRGSHTFETGAQFVTSRVSAVLVQSPTGYGMGAYAGGADPFASVDPQTSELRYNLGDEIWIARYQDIPVDDLESDVDNFAVYAQDAWQLGKWRFDLGLRWERYDVSTYREDLDRSLDALAPRVGVTRNISQRWQIQATWGRYVGRFYDPLFRHTAGVFGYSEVERLYGGPPRTNLSASEVESIIRDDAQWGAVSSVQDPEQPTRFFGEGIELPYTDEFTLGVRAGLPRDTGSLTATYIDRDYKNLMDDFVGDLGEQAIVDPFTGEPLTDPDTGEPTPIDNIVWDNAPSAERRYRAVVVTGEYRPGARWYVGGNWTFSELTGNQDSPDRWTVFGTPIGTYVRSRPEEQAVPDGYLLDDARNRVQVWGNYNWDLNRGGVLALGAVGRYQTGGNWSRSAGVYFADDPEYNNETGQQYEHFFDGRGNNSFDDWWAIDLSARWQVQIYKRLDVWLKATVINVFDNDALLSYDTSGSAVDDDTGNLTWEPQPWFGSVYSQENYQTPRSYVFTLGLAF